MDELTQMLGVSAEEVDSMPDFDLTAYVPEGTPIQYIVKVVGLGGSEYLHSTDLRKKQVLTSGEVERAKRFASADKALAYCEKPCTDGTDAPLKGVKLEILGFVETGEEKES